MELVSASSSLLDITGRTGDAVSSEGGYPSDREELERHLSRQPEYLQRIIRDFLCDERARSFGNVAGQLAAYRDISAKLVEINRSKEAASLRHLLKEIHMRRIQALQDSASAISKEVTVLRQCIAGRDFTRLESLARRIAVRASNFKRKFAELLPQFENLATEVEHVARACENSSRESQELLCQTVQRRDWWFWLFDLIGKTVALGSGAVLAGSVSSLCYLGYLYQGKSAAMGAAKATYAAAKKLLTEKAATAHAAAVQAEAAKATAAARAADVTTANHALQSATGTEVATTAASSHAGPKAVLASLGLAGLADIFLMHGVDVAMAASDAASAAASAASASAAATQVAASTAASQAAAAVAGINSLQVAMGSLSASMLSVAPLAAFSGLVLALCMIGYAGRNVLKRLLGRLWADEIRFHEWSSEGFQQKANDLRDALQKLRATCSCTEKLEEAFAVVVEAADELANEAQCCQAVVLEDDMETLRLKVDTLASSYEEAVGAFHEMQENLRDLSEVRWLVHETDTRAPIASQLALESALEVPDAMTIPGATCQD